MNTNKYIGLPFKANGRDESGLDCWGLVRLFYKNELNIELPSFNTQYAIEDDFRIQELLSQYKEGWQKTETPEPGSAVLFRILGEVTHIGVCVEHNKFLHIRENSDSVLESLDNLKWNKRIEGFYKYVENTGAVLNSIPHPLKTQKVTAVVPEGTTLKELIEKARSESDFSEVSQYRVLVNGIPIQEELWNTFALKNSDTVEYRCILGKNSRAGRIVLTLVVAAVSFAVGGAVYGAVSGAISAAGYGSFAASVGGALAAGAAATATTAVGMKLVDAIAPLVQKDPSDPGTTERQLLIDGGANQPAKYSSIPVVLGRVKMTPPLGAEIFSVFSGGDSTTGSETGTDNFLKILLIWGYGPLSIDYSTLKIGDVALNLYSDVTYQHLDRITEPTNEELDAFDAIYGSDVQQLNGGELPGPKRTVDGVEREGLPPAYSGDGWVPATNPTNEGYVERQFSQPIDKFTIVLHFPQGLRRIVTQGDSAGTTGPAPVRFIIQYSKDGGTTYNSFLKTIGGTLDGNNYIVSGTAKKDAFSWAITVNRMNGIIPRWDLTDNILIRIRRETGKEDEPSSLYRYSHECVLHTVTGYRNEKPAKDPLNVKIAKSAFSIKATEQINGRIEGINAIVQSYCYDYTGTTWAVGPTNNPASLFRYVLTHPGTPNRILDSEIDSKIDLQKLQYWHNYCSTKGFAYNSIIASNNSVMGVLSEICAAGRASPAIVDGKWTVIIDEPQTNIVQHFTPHNSWNFEGSKDVVKYPDCLRARFNDEDNNYQEDEVLVYQAGKNSTNSELFEEVSFPGVTKRSLVIDHARWHMAQAKLRPERYTLETDMEYLVCNRGDHVKVTHDVPLWGLGSGRLKAVLSNTQVELEEPVYLEIGKSYTIRIRKQDGTSVTSTINFSTTGEYSVVNLSTALTGLNELDLYMFGELNKESQDLIVLSIQPNGTNTATITLTDYGITDTYNIFTDYLNYTELPSFVTNITKPPKYLINSFGTKTPLNITALSDETVMERKGPVDFAYRLLIGFVNETDLPKTQNYVECQLDFADSTDEASVVRKTVLAESYSVLFEDVVEGQEYRFRLRYVGEDGRTGPWTSWQNHIIVGKSNPASTVTGLSYTITETGIVLSWDGCTDLDYDTTLVKSGSNWSTATLIFNGKSTSIPITRPATGTYEFLVKHVDTSGNESSFASSTGVINYTNTSINNSNITITSSGTLSGGGGGQVTITGLGYIGELDATKGAPTGTLVGTTLAETVESNAITAKTTADAAIAAVALKLDKASSDILSVSTTDTTRVAGIRVGDLAWDSSGNRTSGKGLALTPYGILGHDGTNPTFSIDINGNAIFKGDITGATGAFGGSLSAATGTFAGSLSAATGTFAGSLSAATGTFTGTITADSIQANTISTTKLIIKTNKGSVLPDPDLLDLNNYSITGNYTYQDANPILNSGSPKLITVSPPSIGTVVETKEFLPLDYKNSYYIAASLFAGLGSNRVATVYINFYNSSLTKLTTSWGDATYSGIIYQGIPSPGGFNLYSKNIGSNTINDIPPETAYCKVGVVLRGTGTDTVASHNFAYFVFEAQKTTDLIAENAVSNVVAQSATSGLAINTDSWVTAISLDILDSSYYSVIANAYYTFTGYTQVRARILKDDTTVIVENTNLYEGGFLLVSTPGNYKLQFTRRFWVNSSTYDVTINLRSLVLTGLKR
jgi:sulfur carrier protein ThiS